MLLTIRCSLQVSTGIPLLVSSYTLYLIYICESCYSIYELVVDLLVIRRLLMNMVCRQLANFDSVFVPGERS